MVKITSGDVKKVAKLANIPLSTAEEEKFTHQFAQTLEVIKTINELDTSKVTPTSQVAGLKNRIREDTIEPERVLTQEQALRNAKSHYNGYFRVLAIFSHEP